MDPGPVKRPARRVDPLGARAAGPEDLAVLMRGCCLAFFLATALAAAGPATGARPQPPDAQRQGELVRLVRNDCGSCHGLTLQGGLGPALLPATLADRPDIALRETILRGRAATAMPPWARFMDEVEAQWVVEQLKQGFPNAR